MLYLREIVAGLMSPLTVASDRRFAGQLRKFAFTEYYTYLDIGAVAERQDDPELRSRMLAHAKDELRHFQIFNEWARRLDPVVVGDFGDAIDEGGLSTRAVQSAVRQAAAPNQRLKKRSQYLQYLFLSESRAHLQFQLYRWLNAYSARLRKALPPVLADEGRHVRYSAVYAWREARKVPLESITSLFTVLWYILVQDVVDLLKVIESIGSTVFTAVLYYLLVTPYGFVLRVLGVARRGRLRSWRPPARQPLDVAFWSAE